MKIRFLASKMTRGYKTHNDDAVRLLSNWRVWLKIPFPVLYLAFSRWMWGDCWKFFRGETFVLVKVTIDGKFVNFRTQPEFFNAFDKAGLFESELFAEEFKVVTPTRGGRKRKPKPVEVVDETDIILI